MTVEENSRKSINKHTQRGEHVELDHLGLIALQEIEVDVHESFGERVVAVVLDQLLLVMHEQERENVHDDESDLMTQVRLDRDRSIQLHAV